MVSPASLLARCVFPSAGTPVSCAVSGGADSLSLLVLAVEAGCQVTAIHVDHGLRQGSAAESDVVAAAAERFGASFRSLKVDVAVGPNLEARARTARYSVLPAEVFTGHTADDQAETVLLNMLRGSGVDGLAAMRRDRRPLLDLRRSDTVALCKALDLPAVEDPMNIDPAYMRVRVRHELLPLMNEIADRDVVPVLARQADRMRSVADLMEQLAEGVDVIDAKVLRTLHPEVAAVALRRWIRDSTGDEHPVDAASIERLMQVVNNEILATEVTGGHRVARTQNRLRIVRAE